MSQYWLMKSEPDVFSIDMLAKQKTSLWDGVRNYQARNFMMKDMQVGDRVLFYHSNAKPSGVAGLARISGAAQPDPSQFDQSSEYFDPKATREQPRWYCVTVKFEKKFKNFVPLEELRARPELKNLEVLKKGQRLSIQKVAKEDFLRICELGGL